MDRTGLWKDRFKQLPKNTPLTEEGCYQTTDTTRAEILCLTEKISILAKDKRPLLKPPKGQPSSKRRRIDNHHEQEPISKLDHLQFKEHEIHTRPDGIDTVGPEQHLSDIIKELGIANNEEQLRALRIIAEHFMFGLEEQLFLYIAGVGGAGKSFIIKAVVEFFRRCGASERMMLSAPTGCAAVLIDGFTIHALTFLPKKDKEKTGSRTAELNKIWKNIQYLVIDEISMVSANLLAEICARLNEACGERTVGTEMLFGKINVIVLGDIGQLRPVRSPSLFAHELVDQITPNIRETCTGVNALYGAWIWREIKKVVILRKNFRAQQDPEYTNLLARVRLGMAWDGMTSMTELQQGNGRNYKDSDFITLHNRQLQGLSKQDRKKFEDAPIICSTKVVRDLINRQLTLNHAMHHNRTMHDYHSRDSFNGLPLNDSLQQKTWQIRSSETKDWVGKLPLSIGMKVMVTENVALKARVVNGAEGILREIHYTIDEKGRRFADCAYVEIPDSNIAMHPKGKDWVPIIPMPSKFEYEGSFRIGRKQLPLLPAYAYTDYKSQGKSLKKVIVDLKGAKSLQSLYVMISRATSLESMAVLRNFKPTTLYSRLGQDFRDEFTRLEKLNSHTKTEFEHRHSTEAIAMEESEMMY
ncbi:PIF1-like helicase-domain-containing protein [Favolaschia claudopus]|uniref:ATP-dependent DNA helicase n=1 Tax=Favolaschia claudopus TaxID=2862362 RepID=A0AAW0CEE7_9AGAR